MKKIQKNFNVNIAKLNMLGHRIISLLERDIAEFGKYGITQRQINEFKLQLETYQNIYFDEVYEQRQMLLSQEKNKLKEELKTFLRNLILKVEMAYKQTNIMYLTISRTKIVKLNSSDLCVHTKAIIVMAEENLEVLSGFGLNQN